MQMYRTRNWEGHRLVIGAVGRTCRPSLPYQISARRSRRSDQNQIQSEGTRLPCRRKERKCRRRRVRDDGKRVGKSRRGRRERWKRNLETVRLSGLQRLVARDGNELEGAHVPDAVGDKIHAREKCRDGHSRIERSWMSKRWYDCFYLSSKCI